MKEEYLHFVFKNKYFGNQFELPNGKRIEVIDFGEHNVNAGPDFLESKIRYDDKVWVGAIEFHVKSSDWYRHKHQYDPAYNAVIAHFVYENDLQVRINGFEVPTIELKSRIDESHFKKYEEFSKNLKQFIPCVEQIKSVDQKIVDQVKSNAIHQRLWNKSLSIISTIEELNGDRLEAFYITLANVFGGKVNALPFAMLMDRFNFNWLAKLNYDPFKVEALLLGNAGFLEEDFDEEYLNQLKNEYSFLKYKFGLSPMDKNNWKYSRMYPNSFPETRIVQFAHLIVRPFDFSKMLDNEVDFLALEQWADLDIDDYWSQHFRIGNSTKQKSNQLSKQFVELMIINVFIPFKYAIGVWEGNMSYKESAIVNLHKIPAEKNTILTDWKKLDIGVYSAYDSQSLLEQKKERCNRKKCLFCGIGQSILNR